MTFEVRKSTQFEIRELTLVVKGGSIDIINIFEEIICLDTGADKDEELAKYAGSEYYWIEDKYANCEAGLRCGLRPILMEHGHNMEYSHPMIPRVKNWKEIYEIMVG